MTDTNVIKIHGKDYVTVAGRLEMAREDIKSINTEVIPHNTMIVIKATVVTKKGTFTGISAANPAKAIEKASPFEVAETSAVGRALGFAGYGAVDSIASADEMAKAESEPVINGGVETNIDCSDCPNDKLMPNVVKFSTEKYGRPLCFSCQKKQP